jgi:hypothetical protein
MLSAGGIPLIVATARTPTGLTVLGTVLQYTAVAVCCNGSIGLDPATGQHIWRHTLGAATVAKIIDILAEHLPGTGFGAYDGQQWTLTPDYFTARGHSPRGPHQIDLPDRLATGTVCALGICHPQLTSDKIADVLTTAGIDPEHATVTFAADDILDIAPLGIDKASGLAQALDFVGIDPQHTMGFGDAPNDLPMFALVGHAVAVANAHPSVLAAADSTTSGVETDGFSNALINFGITHRHADDLQKESELGDPLA